LKNILSTVKKIIMADSSFEERVREELQKLRLKPEEQVWTNVEAALRQEKKRRGLLWFVLLAGLAGAGTVYFLAGGGPEKTSKETALQSTAGKTVPAVRIDSPAQKDHHLAVTPADPLSREKNGSQSRPHVAIHQTDKVVAARRDEVQPLNGQHKLPENIDKPTTTSPAITPGQTGSKPVTKELVVTRQADKEAKENPITVLNQQVDSAKVNTPLPEQDNAGKTSAETTENTSVQVKKIANPGKWTWYLFAEAGKSGYRNAISTSKALNFTASPGNSGSATTGGFVGGASQLIYQDAGSFSVGAQAITPAGRNSSIGISAGYALYRVQTGVGKRYDTLLRFSSVNMTNSNGFVYQALDNSRYTNLYHFATLNVDYYTQFRIGAASLRWRVGLGAALVVSSNALHYDINTSLLFQNNALIPDLQWNAGTGVDIGFAKQRFFVGPQVTWLFPKSSTMPGSSMHLFNAGIRAGISLNKKKN
jgi:hypothetical protein